MCSMACCRELREKDDQIAFLRSGSVSTPDEPASDETAADETAADETTVDETEVEDDERERAQPHDSPKA